MTPSAIAQQLLLLIGVRSLTDDSSVNPLNDTQIGTGDVEACAIAITQGLQEIFALGPTALSEQRYSTTLRPPTNVSFTATQYSTTISAFATWNDWMIGCTIQGGDGEDNELLSATELLRPYQASSGTANCTVYGDAIKLPSWVKNTMDPVQTPRNKRMRAATCREEFLWYDVFEGDPRTRGEAGAVCYNSRNKTSGEPCVYFVDSRYDPSTGELPLFLRVNPMPGGAIPITFRVKRRPPSVMASDITGEGLLTVAGTLSPDSAGDYSKVGTFVSGSGIFRDATDTYLLFFTGGGWILQRVADGLDDSVANSWSLTTTLPSPVGTYTANGTNTGEPIVTANGTLDLVIPTDWHQSILLPISKKWFMSHPAFNNAATAASIMEQYRIAKQTLESFIPQITPTQGRYH